MRAREIVDDVAFAIEMVARATAERVLTGSLFNPKRAELRSDPYPYYRRLRERDPVHRSFGASGWVLTRHDDIVGVLSDRAYSSDERNWVRYRRMIGARRPLRPARSLRGRRDLDAAHRPARPHAAADARRPRRSRRAPSSGCARASRRWSSSCSTPSTASASSISCRPSRRRCRW